jgi:hypothetical protein
MYEHRQPEGNNIRFLVILGLVVGVAVPLLLGFNEWFGVVAAYVLVPPVIATPFVTTGSILSKQPVFRIASFVMLAWFVTFLPASLSPVRSILRSDAAAADGRSQ